MKIKVATYNIKFSSMIFDDEIQEVVSALGSHLICFQEFPMRRFAQWKEALQPLGFVHSLGQKTCETLLGIQQGNVVFSKFPLEDRHSVDLTYKDHEVRKAQYCLVDTGREEVFLLHTHLGLRRTERLFQMHKIVQILDQHAPSEKMVLCGDFNDWNNAGERSLGGFFQEAHFAIHGKYAKTFPARLPLAKLDRIYFRNLGVKDCEVLKGEYIRKKSDHLPLRAAFRL